MSTRIRVLSFVALACCWPLDCKQQSWISQGLQERVLHFCVCVRWQLEVLVGLRLVVMTPLCRVTAALTSA
jgi:hypothetical protein